MCSGICAPVGHCFQSCAQVGISPAHIQGQPHRPRHCTVYAGKAQLRDEGRLHERTLQEAPPSVVEGAQRKYTRAAVPTIYTKRLHAVASVCREFPCAVERGKRLGRELTEISEYYLTFGTSRPSPGEVTFNPDHLNSIGEQCGSGRFRGYAKAAGIVPGCHSKPDKNTHLFPYLPDKVRHPNISPRACLDLIVVMLS